MRIEWSFMAPAKLEKVSTPHPGPGIVVRAHLRYEHQELLVRVTD